MSKKRNIKATVKNVRSRKTASPSKKNPVIICIIIAIIAFVAYYLFSDGGIFSDTPNLPDGFAVHFIDIGQGDCILIQTPDNEFMLIDTGSRSEFPKLISYLENFGVREFRYVVFSHPHEDHIGSAYRIVRDFDITGALIMPPVTNNTRTFERLVDAIEERGIGVTRPIPGDTYRLGDATFTILAPLSEGYSNINDYSVVVLLEYGNTSFLFTGDMERRSENELVNHSIENNIDISADVIKIAHHGSRTSSQQHFLDAINPSIAVIQVCANNTFGHPTGEVINRLEAMDIEIWRNDWHGDVVIVSDGVNLTVHTSRDS